VRTRPVGSEVGEGPSQNVTKRNNRSAIFSASALDLSPSTTDCRHIAAHTFRLSGIYTQRAGVPQLIEAGFIIFRDVYLCTCTNRT
jgi:hypothetical protein